MNSPALGTRDGGLKKSLMEPQPSPLCSAHLCGIYGFSVLFLKYIYLIYLFYLYCELYFPGVTVFLHVTYQK